MYSDDTPTPAQGSEGEWEKEFDELFTRDEWGHFYELLMVEEVKSHIRKLLAAERERIAEMCEKLKGKRNRFERKEGISNRQQNGYNAGLTDALAIIRGK